MSKKQREKVEDEVRYHRAQMRASGGGGVGGGETAPDSSVVFDQQQQLPSSSDQLTTTSTNASSPSPSATFNGTPTGKHPLRRLPAGMHNNVTFTLTAG
ncbi:hypothetical protein J437_LFUL007781 [Ladona fulva]|uniref:Uncharacterized protein n=1 Tax=Ladona fulva TaxID=123851 RepID=A0A8K0K165_LADFU|nr:hypothetical protein J437_LFUL007781 [Ladona fulva]